MRFRNLVSALCVLLVAQLHSTYQPLAASVFSQLQGPAVSGALGLYGLLCTPEVKNLPTGADACPWACYDGWRIRQTSDYRLVWSKVGADYAAAFGDKRKPKICMHGMSARSGAGAALPRTGGGACRTGACGRWSEVPHGSGIWTRLR